MYAPKVFWVTCNGISEDDIISHGQRVNLPLFLLFLSIIHKGEKQRSGTKEKREETGQRKGGWCREKGKLERIRMIHNLCRSRIPWPESTLLEEATILFYFGPHLNNSWITVYTHSDGHADWMP